MLTGVVTSLPQSSFEIGVITSDQLYENSSARLPARDTLAGATIIRLSTSRFGRRRLMGRFLDYASFYLLLAVHLFRTLKPGDIVVAKTDPPMLSIIVAPIARYKQAVSVNWLQDVFPEILQVKRGKVLVAMLKAIRNMSLRASHCNVVIGHLMARYIEEQGVDPRKIELIPNWADPDIIQVVPPMRSELRRTWSPQAGFVVAYSGNLGRVHDIGTLVEAAAEIQRSDREAGNAAPTEFLIIGGGAQRDVLATEIRERGIENVQFLPYQPQNMLAASLAAADAHLVTLRPELEGFVVPSKIYGVLAAGRPVLFVGSPDGELATVVRANDCGVVVPAGDASRLASVIRDVAQHEPERDRMGRNARALFDRQFSKSISATRWVALLERLSAQTH